MKIAILTLPLHTNYGGILQAYALQTVLERMGHEVEVLQKVPRNGHQPYLMPLVYTKRIIKKLFRDSDTIIFYERKQKREKRVRESNTSLFIEKYINLRFIKKIYNIKPTDYEGIVVGSDQVWRKRYFYGMWQSPIQTAYLGFTREWNLKRISYAASFGLDNLTEYTPEDILECKKGINTFDGVSVREDSGVSICKKYFDVDSCRLLDPTMLLNKEDYMSLVAQSDVPRSSGNMMCYILDPTTLKDNVISTISHNNHLTPFFVNADVDNSNLPIEKRIQPPVESWLRGFMDAKFVVTDSFHACVFSIIFGKPFIAIGNSDRGLSRFISLLSAFKLENRLITKESDLDKVDFNSNRIDSELLIDLRAKSLEFLKSHLKG